LERHDALCQAAAAIMAVSNFSGSSARPASPAWSPVDWAATGASVDRAIEPISNAELERRWTAVRASMRERGIDVLVLQNNGDHLGGYVKYLTDVPAITDYPLSVVLPLEDPMTVVMHGPRGGDRAIPALDDPVFRGADRILTSSGFASVHYTRGGDAGLVLRALQDYERATIGLVGTAQMSHAFGETLRAGLPDATFVEASALVDAIKMIKSKEEQELLRRTCALQDDAMRRAFAVAQPGCRDRDVAVAAFAAALELGAEQGIVLCASAPAGAPALLSPPHLQGRTVCDGDVLIILIETNGPGGVYAELGRTCVLGDPPAQLVEETAFALEAQRFCVDMMTSGEAAADIFAAYNDFMVASGRPPEDRLHAHGQGYDMVERPLVRDDEQMTIVPDVNLACHPYFVGRAATGFMCDNFLIGRESLERVHRFPQQLVTL
jgi:Xaa-Pro aminopeptidase